MRLLVSVIAVPLRPDIQRQVILVDGALPVVVIFPDKTALVAVLTDRRLAENLPIFVDGIQVKHKDPARIEVIIDQRKNLPQLVRLQDII